MTANKPIDEKVDRIETIIDTLESGDVSLQRANELHEEGQDLIEELQSLLDVGDGDIVEKSN